jgi:hypothetical protein
MNSRRLIAAPRGSGRGIVAAQTCTGNGPDDVRFGSKADIAEDQPNVCFTSKSGHQNLGRRTNILDGPWRREAVARIGKSSSAFCRAAFRSDAIGTR